MTIAFRAMEFARLVHANQQRKYTGNPYADHLAEVAGIVSTVYPDPSIIAVAWLHDCMEDQGVTFNTLLRKFDRHIASGVEWLTDVEVGNRAARQAAARDRLGKAPGWVQTIKCADLISNTSSIVMHDPKFATVYLEEKRLMLEVLNRAHPLLLRMAKEQVVYRTTTLGTQT